MHSITREEAVKLNRFIVQYRTSMYDFKFNERDNLYEIYRLGGDKLVSRYYKEDLKRSVGFEYYLPKRNNTINY